MLYGWVECGRISPQRSSGQLRVEKGAHEGEREGERRSTPTANAYETPIPGLHAQSLVLRSHNLGREWLNTHTMGNREDSLLPRAESFFFYQRYNPPAKKERGSRNNTTKKKARKKLKRRAPIKGRKPGPRGSRRKRTPAVRQSSAREREQSINLESGKGSGWREGREGCRPH